MRNTRVLYGPGTQIHLSQWQCILLRDIKSLNKNTFKYQRLWLKKQHLPGGENCAITYNVPGCLPVEKQVMENVHIQHKEEAKPQLHKYSNSIVILHLKK